MNDDLTDSEFDYFVPLMMAPRVAADPDTLRNRDIRELTVAGRLKPGVSVKQAQAEASAIAASLAKEYPETNGDRQMAVITGLRGSEDSQAWW